MSSAKSREGAFTIAELLIAGTLLLGMLALIVQVLIPVMRASQRTANRVELQSLAAVSLQAIVTDLTHSGATGVSGPFQEENGSLSFALHPNAGFDSDAKPLWADRLVVYRWDFPNRTLTRTLWPVVVNATLVSPTKVSRLNIDELQTALEEGATKTLAYHVELFEVSGSEEPGTELPVELRLRLEKATDAEFVETIELKRKVLLRN
jgi:type II secretory pathway component PulJ